MMIFKLTMNYFAFCLFHCSKYLFT